MKRERSGAAQALPGIAVLALLTLLTLFAVVSTMLAVFGAQAYCGTTARTERHGSDRVISAFIRNAARADDRAGAIAVEQIDGMDVLCIASEEDGERYIKRIYVSDGSLRELYTSRERPFDPEGGETICPARGMRAEEDGGLLRICVTDAGGREITVYAALRARNESTPREGEA